MATQKQNDANRLNAQKSTGPRTVAGKLKSRRNAVRHGLTANVIVPDLECATEFGAFERRIKADYAPRCNTDRELLMRLVNVMWRLRRAVFIECGLFSSGSKHSRQPYSRLAMTKEEKSTPGATLADAFSNMSHSDGCAFDRLRRYEVTLWRQSAQLLFYLDGCRRSSNTRASRILNLSPSIQPDELPK